MRLRVLHLTEAFGGGIATAIEQYLALPEFEQSLLARVRPEFNCLPPTEASLFVRDLPALLREWRTARQLDYDIVHAHSSIAALVARSWPHPRAPLVYSPHALATHHRRRVVRSLAPGTERLLARRTAAFGAVSDSEGAQLFKLCGSRVPIVKLPHALEVDMLPVPLTSRHRRVVAVGRLSYQKNPESIASLPQEIASEPGGALIEFVWVGDGDQERKSQLQAGGWKVTGWLPHEEVLTQLRSAVLLVHPARYEGMPFTVLEALAVGTPVVAADIDCMRELPSVVRYRSNDDLLSAISRLFTNRDTWERLSVEGRTTVSTGWNTSRQIESLQDLYRSAMRQTFNVESRA